MITLLRLVFLIRLVLRETIILVVRVYKTKGTIISRRSMMLVSVSKRVALFVVSFLFDSQGERISCPLGCRMTNPARRIRFIDAFEIALVTDDGAIAFASSFDFRGKTACLISRYRLKRNNLFVGNDR